MSQKDSSKDQTSYFQVDWLDIHSDTNGSPKKLLPVTPEAKSFLDHFWPSSGEYANPFRAIFLVQVPTLELLNVRDSWIIRDGLIPLMWFFKRHPRPTGLKSKIYVHHNLAPYIPEAWGEFVGTYQLVSKSPFEKKQEPQIILLTGIMMDTYFPVKSIPIYFDNLKKQLDSTLAKKLPKVAFLPGRSGGHHENDSAYHVTFMKNLCDVFGTDIVGLSNTRFRSLDSLENYLVLDLNEQIVCADPEPLHFALSRGAQLFQSPEVIQSKKGYFESLSASYGLWIEESTESSVSIYKKANRDLKEIENYYQKYLNAFQSSAHHNLPWPKWFAEWAQTAKSR